jgi:hypothetical protein
MSGGIKIPEKMLKEVAPIMSSANKSEESSVEVTSTSDSDLGRTNVPLIFKLGAILMVSAIGFGSHWSSGVTGAMKTTLKKAGY